MNLYKNKKLENEIRKSIYLIILKKAKDKRLKNINFLSIKLSLDRTIIKVFYNFFIPDNIDNSIKLLNKSSNFIKFYLSKMILFKYMPKIIFLYDYHMEKIIRTINLINNF